MCECRQSRTMPRSPGHTVAPSPAHVVSFMHPEAPSHAPQAHAASHVRISACVPLPHTPHATSRRSVSPAEHSPSPVQLVHGSKSPHVHDESQVRVRCCVPHRPHARISLVSSPGLQAPPPVHTPSSAQVPPGAQTCAWVPHSAHGSDRVAPSVQSQSVGASQLSQSPSVHRSRPGPQAPAHDRSAMRPIVGSESSQSTLAATPSPSMSGGPESRAGSPVSRTRSASRETLASRPGPGVSSPPDSIEHPAVSTTASATRRSASDTAGG